MQLSCHLKAFALAIVTFLQPFTSVASAQAGDECRLAVMGDSLTAGYEIPFEEAFPAQLERWLADSGITCTVENHGVSGDTTAGGLSRLDWVLGSNPTHLIIELGANDGLRALPVANMRDNLAAIIEGAKDRNIAVFLAGMLAPPNLGPDYTESFRSVFIELSEKYDVPLYPFFMADVTTVDALLLDDGLHPNPQGVAQIVNNIGPLVKAWITPENP